MADSNSPAFVPPVNAVRDTDPMIVRIPLDKTDIGFRPSAAKSVEMTNNMTLNHISNGK